MTKYDMSNKTHNNQANAKTLGVIILFALACFQLGSVFERKLWIYVVVMLVGAILIGSAIYRGMISKR